MEGNPGPNHLSDIILMQRQHCHFTQPETLPPPPFPCHPLSPGLHPSSSCASAAILPSFPSLPGVLCFFASSLHRPPPTTTPSSPPPHDPRRHPLSLSSPPTRSPPPPRHLLPVGPPPPPPHTFRKPPLRRLSLTPSLLSPPSLPVLPRCHHAISYRFVTFRFSLGIHNPLHVSVRLFFVPRVPCFISST